MKPIGALGVEPLETARAIDRGRYDGMLQILKFNWHLYASMAAVVTLMAAFAAMTHLAAAWKIGAIAIAAIAMYWGCASLAVSHWVYDLSPIYRWEWIRELFDAPPETWANIHAGLDESTSALKQIFPGTRGAVFDIFDAHAMTEKSIAAARKSRNASEKAVAADFRALPIADATLSAVFLIFAAHELRKKMDREEFFRESGRVLKSDGCLLLVEHLRDWKNFAAFGPGFLHFLPRSAWLEAVRPAGLQIDREFSMTPFVRVFVFRKKYEP